SLGVRPFVHELAHAGRHAVLGELLEIDRVDARVLVLVFDLAAAVLDADVHAHEHPTFISGERVAEAAEGDGEITRGIWGSVEVLMEHLIWRREHPSMFPIDAHEVPLALVPQQRETMAGDGKDVKIGTVAMRFFI